MMNFFLQDIDTVEPKKETHFQMGSRARVDVLCIYTF